MVLSARFSRSFPGTAVIAVDFELAMDRFGLTVLFGPSGCGKTTVLRCLAGLERPDSGAIRVGDRTWFQAPRQELPACRRGIGYVFQDPALFPHLSVAGNIGYGLAGGSRAERTNRIQALMAALGLEGLGGRRPGELSGGQKQRVALARALAPRPRLVLLDEPFAALDRASAQQLRHPLRQLLQDLGTPALLVTHDPQEALALGDRMLLMREGRIVRDGPPARVLSEAAGAAEGPMGAVLRTRVAGRAEGLLRLTAGSAELFAPDPGGAFQEAYACIRGEGVALETGAPGALSQRNRLQATILRIEAQGPLRRVYLEAGMPEPLEALVTAWACDDLGLAPGRAVHALVKASAIRVVPIDV
jgi:molybdate transport system ATP-binding protein